jgi:hypothetical protein
MSIHSNLRHFSALLVVDGLGLLGFALRAGTAGQKIPEALGMFRCVNDGAHHSITAERVLLLLESYLVDKFITLFH